MTEVIRQFLIGFLFLWVAFGITVLIIMAKGGYSYMPKMPKKTNEKINQKPTNGI